MSNRSRISQIAAGDRPDIGIAHTAGQSAAVFIFKPVRPRSYVSRMARIIVEAKSAEFGEELLLRDMRVISQDLIDAGADAAAVRREVGSLEAAIRSEVWRLVLTPGADDDGT